MANISVLKSIAFCLRYIFWEEFSAVFPAAGQPRSNWCCQIAGDVVWDWCCQIASDGALTTSDRSIV